MGDWRERRLQTWITSNRKPRGIRSTVFKSNSFVSTRQSNRRRNHMLSQAQRTTILELHAQQVSKREIARVLGISRVAVRKVLRANSTTVPEIQRPEKAEPYRQQILELFDTCQGNLVRVHEELVAGGAELSYAALTAFCRRHGIGYAPPTPAGRYDFAPGRGASARHVAPRSRTGRQETQGADRVGSTLLFADAVLPVLP
jgi:transposase